MCPEGPNDRNRARHSPRRIGRIEAAIRKLNDLLLSHSTPSQCPVDRQVFDCLNCDDAGVNLPLKDLAGMAAKDIDKVFKALADPSRRQLIDSLHAKNGQTLSELCEGLDMARQSVTQHLDFLEAANLISVQWQGREKLHYFNPVPIHEIYERWLRKFEQERLAALHSFKARLERK
jgi:DNA-binding transcriptional ArsR family regulator